MNSGSPTQKQGLEEHQGLLAECQGVLLRDDQGETQQSSLTRYEAQARSAEGVRF